MLYSPKITGSTGSTVTIDALTGQISWNTGLGAINQIAGPSDQAFSIVATAPVQAASSVAGNALNLTAANATAGSSVAGAAAGGSVSIVGGDAARFTSGNAAGGSVAITGGAAIGTGTGGTLTLTSGLGSGTLGGAINIISARGGASGGTSGTITISSTGFAAADAGGGDIVLVTGNLTSAIGTSGSGAKSGNITLTTGNSQTVSSATGSGASSGGILFAIGLGGAESGNTSGTGGNGGAYTVTGGAGGAATGAGGTHLGGNGSAITLTTGAGGAATGASGTRTGGNSGTLTLATGAAGTGASANGTVGTIVLSPGGTTVGTVSTTGLTLAGGTITAASAPVLSLTQTWNGSGIVFTGLLMNVTNTLSSGSSLLMDLQVGGASKFNVSTTGTIVSAGNFNGLNIIVAGSGILSFSARSKISSLSDGSILLQNNAGTDFSRLQFGLTTSAAPSLKRNAAGLDVRLADDSDYTSLACSYITWQGQKRVTSPFVASSSTSLTNITELVIPSLTAGNSYEFVAKLFVNADVTGGSKFCIGGTATGSIIYQIMYIDNATKAYTIMSTQTGISGSVGQAGSTAGFCVIDGTISVGASGSGSLSVCFAQNVGAGTSSILSGSKFIVNNII